MCGLRHCWDFQSDANLDELLLSVCANVELSVRMSDFLNGVIIGLTLLFPGELSGAMFFKRFPKNRT